MALRHFQASMALSTIQFCSGTTKDGKCRRGRSRLSAFQGQQWLEGLVCERLEAEWRYWDLPDLEELALRDQDQSYLSCRRLKISSFLFLLSSSGISLSLLTSSWHCWQSAAAATPLYNVLQPQATGSCFELARKSSIFHILHTWQSSSVL